MPGSIFGQPWLLIWRLAAPDERNIHDKPFKFSTYISPENNDGEYLYYALPQNDSELLLAISESIDKQTPNDECHIINMNENLEYLKEEKYKYSDFYTYEKVLMIRQEILNTITI
jgi:hypothetical protein